jgi:hypothetical protein
MNTKSGLLTIVTSGLLLMAFPAWCGVPFFTDDPETVDYQHSEMNIAAELTTTQSENIFSPVVEYNYGALPNFQLSISVPYVFLSPNGQARQHGVGDIVLGAKYRFLQETDSHPMMAISPSVMTATGDANKELGNGASQIFLPVWIQKTWGDWKTNGGAGYMINNAPGANNHWLAGIEIQKDISERLTIGGEVFHEGEQLPADTSSTNVGLGIIYNLDQHRRFLFSASDGREHSDVDTQNRFTSYIGYGLAW